MERVDPLRVGVEAAVGMGDEGVERVADDELAAAEVERELEAVGGGADREHHLLGV